jgi:hypothetical protein
MTINEKPLKNTADPPLSVHPEMVDLGSGQGPSEFSTTGIEWAIPRIENERKRRPGSKDAFLDGRYLNSPASVSLIVGATHTSTLVSAMEAVSVMLMTHHLFSF